MGAEDPNRRGATRSPPCPTCTLACRQTPYKGPPSNYARRLADADIIGTTCLMCSATADLLGIAKSGGTAV